MSSFPNVMHITMYIQYLWGLTHFVLNIYVFSVFLIGYFISYNCVENVVFTVETFTTKHNFPHSSTVNFVLQFQINCGNC